jgi:hypothetical protein
VREGYAIEACRSPDEVLLLTAGAGRTVNPAVECARVQFPQSVVGPGGRVPAEVRALLRTVYRLLDLQGPNS